MTEALQKLLLKVGEFTNIAVDEIDGLKGTIKTLQEKQAMDQAVRINKSLQLETALEKAANALYDSDFLTCESERRNFLKLAKADPVFLANMMVKVCKAADVSLIGSPASVAIIKKADQSGFRDPIAERAFGTSGYNGIQFLEGDDD